MKIEFDGLMPTSIPKILGLVSTALLSSIGCSSQTLQATVAETQELQTVGWIENGQVSGIDQEIKFKLDTGATTTSINAEILEEPNEITESGGMIRFRFSNGDGISEVYELPVKRWVKIESRTQDYIRRPVVQMKLCVAGRWVDEEVNLADRSDFNYSVLIGRNMLSKGKLAIDSSATFTQNFDCSSQEDQQ